jgi:hypothetical protein
VDVTVVGVGVAGVARTAEVTAVLATLGPAPVPVSCSDPLDRAALDRVLDRAADGRLVLCAQVGDLAAVLRRLWRRGELAERETAWLPIGPVPRYLLACGVATSLPDAAAIAVRGTVRTVGVLADDSGGVVVGSAGLRPWRGRRLWVRAFVDDERVCDGEVSALRVERGAQGELRATAVGRFGRTVARISGRAAQLACDEAALTSDGVPRQRPRRKRIWWAEPDLWRLALPTAAPPVAPDASR